MPLPMKGWMKETLESHLAWLSSNGLEGRRAELDTADLSHHNFAEQYFDGAILPHANMKKACFNNASFRKASLQGADFRKADLAYVNFEGANLAGAMFDGAVLCHAHFDGANLNRASFCKADLTGATFRNADLTDVDFRLCGFPHDAAKGAKVSDKVIFPIIKNMAEMDMSACSEEIRVSVVQLGEQIAEFENERKKNQTYP